MSTKDKSKAVNAPLGRSRNQQIREALPPEETRRVLRDKRFLAADRAAMDLGELATWDTYLLRERRLLVPMDVQALYIPPGHKEEFVRLPMLLAGPNGQVVEKPEDGFPAPFAKGATRPAGVHLHWAMPDALLRGKLQNRADGSANRLSLPVLPDRWVVLRLMLPVGATEVVLTGWVLEADRAVAVPLGNWTEGGSASQQAVPAGAMLNRDQLTGTVGGSVSWAATYDAVLNRFSMHDPLTDVAALAPKGVDENCAAYLVAGWWSDPALDALDSARSDSSLHELLDKLRWRLLYEWGDEQWALQEQKAQFDLQKALGLTTAERWSSPRPFIPPDMPLRTRAAQAQVSAYTPIAQTFIEQPVLQANSAFAADAEHRYVAKPWHLRSSLLHGAIYGVPVTGAVIVDRRPSASTLGVAMGHHDGDLLAAFAAPAQANPDQRRATERLLGAFTAQKVNRLGSPDGIADLEDREHATAFQSLPSGSAGTDRYLQRVQTGGVGGLGLGRSRAVQAGVHTQGLAQQKAGPKGARSKAMGGGQQNLQSQMAFASNYKPTLFEASAAVIKDLSRSRVGELLAPTEARVVNRPAPRFTFSTEPMVAIRGAARSLRHGNDGIGSADGKLTCRWPTQVIDEIAGVIAKTRFINSLGNGSVPSEVTTLARELVLHDPYHDAWVANAVSPSAEVRVSVFKRLQAESAMRFGLDGTYDGTTMAFHPNGAKTKAAKARQSKALGNGAPIEPGIRQQQTMMADELMRFSLYKGADPDLIGITTWGQPWVPMWLEWELKVEGLDPPTLEAWALGAVDLDANTTEIVGDGVVLRGRAQITVGAADTLHDAIDDWLKAEDALDATPGGGLIDEKTEDAYRMLDEAVKNLDIVTAALDGVRNQLLGFAAPDGLRRPANGDGVGQPAPVQAPHAMLAGAVTLTKARLLDTFGRTIDVPLTKILVPTRSARTERPGALEMAPRLLRPARWLLRLVDSATPVGAEGTEARVDQIEASLQVNPVAGFVMPDHLDESLEIFHVDGSPIGELLHEAVSGGVMWEIAAGRTGPADAGPMFDLGPQQQVLGRLAVGLVAADAAERAGAPADVNDANSESALSAFLRAIDTTLWSVDTFAALGSEHVAGLVGRPIAVARAQLRLELRPPEDVDLSDPDRAEEWAQAERAAQAYAFPVRIGEITRSDDGVLGFFVDDDFSRFRLVDKSIAGQATESGRSRGQLGLYAQSTGLPAKRPITHAYIAGKDDDDTLMLHLNQTVTLTVLMHPSGKATLSSGVLPRKALALARDWVGPGLAKIAPSLRTGPVLVETDLAKDGQVRLPKVSVFGKDQNFLWRDTPATWRTDAILAATQTALLPDSPAEFREGWIRVAPEKPEE